LCESVFVRSVTAQGNCPDLVEDNTPFQAVVLEFSDLASKSHSHQAVAPGGTTTAAWGARLLDRYFYFFMSLLIGAIIVYGFQSQ
jgi:hypothetical protein